MGKAVTFWGAQVQVRPGQTVMEALSKAMKRRKLTTEMCVVYKCSTR